MRKLYSWLMPFSVVIAGIECCTAIILRSGAIGVAGSASIVFVLMLRLAKPRIERGELEEASFSISTGLIVASVVGSIAFPAMMSVMLLCIVMAVAFAVPYVERHALNSLCVTAWIAAVVVAVLSHVVTLFPQPSELVVNAMTGLEVGAAMWLLLLSFRQVNQFIVEHARELLAESVAQAEEQAREAAAPVRTTS